MVKDYSYTSWHQSSIENFLVMACQANFASHHTHDRQVGFLFPQSGIGKLNKMSKNFSFSLYHNTKLQLSNNNISTYTQCKFKILLRSKSKITGCFVVFFCTPHCTKRKPRSGYQSCPYKCAPRHANPL